MNKLAPEDYDFYYDTFWNQLYCDAITEYYYISTEDLFDAHMKAHSFVQQIKSGLMPSGWQLSDFSVKHLRGKVNDNYNQYVIIEVNHVDIKPG